MKKVLITAGPVYGKLDDNKLVSNRVRGLWACRFARYLGERGHHVTLLVPRTMTRVMVQQHTGSDPCAGSILITHHDGFENYRDKCCELAPEMNAAVMAAAVVNWIPAKPFKGKMPTDGFQAGDIIDIPFVLAERVIDGMKTRNPELTLIGCKMLSGTTETQLLDTAYEKVLIAARCNVVLANDMRVGLKRKWLVYPDGSRFLYDSNFDMMYADLLAAITDIHYRTEWERTAYPVAESGTLFDDIVQANWEGFVRRSSGSDRVFGSVYVPTGDIALGIASPREKGALFSAKDAVVIESIEDRVVKVTGPNKATLNAPLLVRVAQKYPKARAVLHQHSQLPDVPTVEYAPPGTVRDNERNIPGPVFNIEGHGFIRCIE